MEIRRWMLVFLALLFCSKFSAEETMEGSSKGRGEGSKFIPKPGQRLDTILSFYEIFSLNPVDESALEEPPSDDSLAAKDGEFPTHLRIAVLNRTFSLHLHRGESAFTEDATIVVHGETPEETLVMDAADFRSDYVEGFLLGEPRSSVRGHVQEGAFFGTLATADESYYVEPANTYFSNAGPLDAIVYRERDVKIGPSPWSSSFCYSDSNGRRSGAASGGENETAAAEDGRDGRRFFGQPTRAGKACKVKVVADHYFFRAYGGSSLRRTLADMEYHVREADKMFRETDIDNDGVADEVRIRLAKAEVFQTPSDPSYILGDPKLNASSYLELFSLYDHGGFCGAMAFSQRTFDKDVLGFAYRGAPERSGGICNRRQAVEGRMRSLNVGMTSFDFRGTTLPRARSTVVFTHELGHMFGSPHDEDSDGGACFLQAEEKHYIMSAIANPGLSATNRRFSQCSTKLMFQNMKVHGDCLHCRGRECGRGRRVDAGWPPAALWIFLTVWMLAVGE